MRWNVRVFIFPSSPNTTSSTFVRERKRVSACLVLLTEGRIHITPGFVLTQNVRVDALTYRSSTPWSTEWNLPRSDCTCELAKTVSPARCWATNVWYRLSDLHDFHAFDTHRLPVDLPSRQGSLERPGPEPGNTIAKAFSYDSEFDSEQFKPLVNYLERQVLPEGHVLFRQGDVPDALYIIESGVLRALYRFAEHVPTIEESMVPGTLAGELTGLSGLERNATVLVERDAVVWKLSREKLKALETERPGLAQVFTKLVMRGE